MQSEFCQIAGFGFQQWFKLEANWEFLNDRSKAAATR